MQTKSEPDDTTVISALYDIAKSQNVDVSAISWNGFNLMGDEKSIREVQRLMFCESQLHAMYDRMNK